MSRFRSFQKFNPSTLLWRLLLTRFPNPARSASVGQPGQPDPAGHHRRRFHLLPVRYGKLLTIWRLNLQLSAHVLPRLAWRWSKARLQRRWQKLTPFSCYCCTAASLFVSCIALVVGFSVQHHIATPQTKHEAIVINSPQLLVNSDNTANQDQAAFTVEVLLTPASACQGHRSFSIPSDGALPTPGNHVDYWQRDNADGACDISLSPFPDRGVLIAWLAVPGFFVGLGLIVLALVFVLRGRRLKQHQEHTTAKRHA